MSHFTTLVIINGDVPTEDLQDVLEKSLQPFNENKDVELYIGETRQEIIDAERKSIEGIRDNAYAEYSKDPDAYRERYSHNQGHLEYMADEFPNNVLRNFHDESFLFEKGVEFDYHKDSEGQFSYRGRTLSEDELEDEGARTYFVDENGDRWTVRNPNSKWDWWTIGGRWDRMLNSTAVKGEKYNGVNMTTKGSYRSDNETPFSVLDKDGTWYERGEMGWWGMVSNEKEQTEWKDKVAELISSADSEDYIVLVDCHI